MSLIDKMHPSTPSTYNRNLFQRIVNRSYMDKNVIKNIKCTLTHPLRDRAGARAGEPQAMRTYRVCGTLTITVVIDVEAENPEQAKELADGAGVMSLCHQCSDAKSGVWHTTGELDGQPEIIADEEVIDLGPATGRRRR